VPDRHIILAFVRKHGRRPHASEGKPYEALQRFVAEGGDVDEVTTEALAERAKPKPSPTFVPPVAAATIKGRDSDGTEYVAPISETQWAMAQRLARRVQRQKMPNPHVPWRLGLADKVAAQARPREAGRSRSSAAKRGSDSGDGSRESDDPDLDPPPLAHGGRGAS
jgi:hypothetical protein